MIIKYFYVVIIDLITIIIIMMLNSCWFDKSKPNRVYMPDMYYSDAYEPYSDPYPDYKKPTKVIQLPFFLGKKGSSLLPVKGTVPRNSYGFFSYNIPNTNEGYNDSKKIVRYPLQKKENQKIQNKNKTNKIILEDGKNIYQINCSICHGNNGDGQGFLVKNEKILGIPSYKDRDITIGSVYHVVTYGKNNMSSYASQLNEIDRWKVAEYVMYLKNK
ncbi:c-type cytochrome [Blattabacterium cuenoti]|uniref:c-type cytochrome n=1 Tax=Blattabacterium cuenoti TaxID=1653831 RepID=UPI00163CEC36|nr:cytochrome c [Blattabacterium cuenoti]